MNNKILIIFILSIFLVWGSVFTYYIMDKDNIKEINKNNSWTIQTWSIRKIDEENKNEKKELSVDDKKNRINELKKKLALKWLIEKWDLSSENWNYTYALVNYLQIYKDIPNDKNIIKKIADTYYNLKKFDKAYEFYSKIKDYDKLDKNIVSKTLISSISLKETENIEYLNNELETLGLNEEELYYYQKALECVVDFSLCRKDYQDYFEAKTDNSEVEWTWAIENEIKFQELLNIKIAIENYWNFDIDDLDYKWALVSWAFYENWLFPIAIETSKKILEHKKDYKPLIKIIAKSYFELWNYIQAKLYLLEYLELEKRDSEISFFLWIVYENLREFLLSNIHLNNAIDYWYENKLDVYKRILFNYYEMWEIEKILEIFDKMVNEYKDEMSIDDFNLAIYYNIINENLKKAKEYTQIALNKYTETEIFYWYMWWILMEENDVINKFKQTSSSWSINKEKYLEAWKFIDKWLKISTKSPMLNLVKWKLENKIWDNRKAFLYFKKTLSLDNNWEFGKIAETELKNLEINK